MFLANGVINLLFVIGIRRNPLYKPVNIFPLNGKNYEREPVLNRSLRYRQSVKGIGDILVFNEET